MKIRKHLIDSCSKNEHTCQKYVFKKDFEFREHFEKKKKTTAIGKLQEIKVQRNIFPRILGIASSTKQAVMMEKLYVRTKTISI